jgi:hypothetical protein
MFDWVKNNIPSVNIPDITNIGKTLLRSAVDSSIDKILPKKSSTDAFDTAKTPSSTTSPPTTVQTVSNFESAPAKPLTDTEKFNNYKNYIRDTIDTYTKNISKEDIQRGASIGGDYRLLMEIGVKEEVLDPLKEYLYAEFVVWKDWEKGTNKEANPKPSNFADITTRNTNNRAAIESYSAALEEEVIRVLANKYTVEQYNNAKNTINSVTIVNMDSVRYKSKIEHDKLVEQNAVYDADDINYKGMIKLSGKTIYILGIIYYAFVIAFATMVSIFVANDLLHKRPAFRVFAFLITFFNCLKPTTGFIWLLIHMIYFIKRRISYANGKGNTQDRLLFLSLIPCYQVEPDVYDNTSSFWKFLNTYTLGEKGSSIHTIVENNKINYAEAREKCLESTEILQNSLLMSRKI